MADGVSSHGVELCPYAAHGHCPYADECVYVHGDVCELCHGAVLSPFDPEQRQRHTQVSTSLRYIVITVAVLI